MNNNKPNLVLIPGILCDEWVWRQQVRDLSDIANITVAYLRGYRSLAAMGEAILRKAPDHFALAGHSMGGRVALEIMGLNSSRVSRLALLDTGVHPVAADEESRRVAQNQKAREQGMGAIAQTWIPEMLHPDRVQDKTLISGIQDMLLRMTADDLTNQNAAMLRRRDAAPLLPTITCPTLFVCGRQDNYSPLQRHEQMAEMVAGARLDVIEDCGHMSTLERPEQISRCLKHWLVS